MPSPLPHSPAHALDVATAVPPTAAARPERSEIHGVVRMDEYAWLRRRDDPAVTAYLEAENAYTEAVMRPTVALQERLYDEMLSHIKQTDLSVPYRLGDFWYYARTEEGRQYPIYARKPDQPDAVEQVTLDLNELAEGLGYLGLGAYEISDDGNFLAYSLDTTGYRQYTLHVKDLRTNRDLGEAISRVNDVVWARDNQTFFYTTEDETTKRRDRFWRKTLGLADATLLYEETDARFDLGAGRSNDRDYVFAASFSRATSEWRYVPADRPHEAPTVVLPRSEGHRYSVEHYGESFFIVTNREAEDFRLVAAPDTAPDERNWTEIVGARAGVHISGLDVFEHRGVLRVRSGGFANLEILDLATGALTKVRLPEDVHAVFPSANPEFHTDAYRFSYTSLVTPNSVFELDLVSGSQRLLKATEVPGYDPAAYATDLLHATARDGTSIPISIVRRRDVPRDGAAPLLLHGYGSYGISMDPTFSPARLVLLDRGVSYAIAHIRGGGELGEPWRTAGHLRQKLNTFTDFIDCAEYLIAEGFTTPQRLAIQGGSAGGLLVGAVSNMRPDLFGAVVSQVPFVDVLNTMLDDTLPLTTGEYLEWGNPNVPADYDYMARYSPYDNVARLPYPATLVRVSINDSQVPYWEGAKLVARMRALGEGDRPLLLLTNFGAGHGGASGRYDYLREIALNNAFILAIVAPETVEP